MYYVLLYFSYTYYIYIIFNIKYYISRVHLYYNISFSVINNFIAAIYKMQ